MESHPLNLALRFVLELVALWAMTYWGWTQHTGAARWGLAVGIPLVAAVIWGTFRVPNDPGDPPIAVPGWLRLLLELTFFGGAIILLYTANQHQPAVIFLAVIVVHYLISYDRIIWLLTEV